MELRTFGINTLVSYEEIVYDNSIVNKAYLISNPKNVTIKGIPDACIDLQFVEVDGKIRIYLAGSHMHGQDAQIMNYQRVFGIRFQPGVQISNWCREDFTFEELVESRWDITEMLDMHCLIYKFQSCASFKELLESFWKSDFWLLCKDRDYMVSYLMREVEKEKGNLNIAALAEKTGYTQRYINRICKDKIGFSLKKYAEIIRMQNALELLRQSSEEKMYDKLGYYDQAHFIHSFKDFTCVTPKKYQTSIEEIYFV